MTLRSLALFVLFVCAARSVAATDLAAQSAPPEHADAALLDVQFVSPTTGWAVGERGVVLNTRDGGRTWVYQHANVACRLAGVKFLNADEGWIVGGATAPYSNQSRGCVLNTNDGGRTWRAAERLVIPALDGARFFDDKNGIAYGRDSPAFPAGVWTTSDGGQTWRQAAPAEDGVRRAWIAADFLDSQNGVVAGRDGIIAELARRKVTPSTGVDFGLRAVHAIRMRSDGHGWLIGDGGLIRMTPDAGRSWVTPVGAPSGAAAHFDFHALAVHGDNIWLAGSPGTVVFHSPDGGANWRTFPTGRFAPLHAMTFVDPMRGWAVGELGTILATVDGGNSWSVQRAGGEQAALLAVVATSRDAPLNMLAKVAAADGYLATVETVFRQSARGDRPAAESDRDACSVATAREAILAVGATAATSAWRFPAPKSAFAPTQESALAWLDQLHDGKARRRMEERLVRQIRTWRPLVVVTHPPPGQYDANPLSAIVGDAMTRAIEAAADPTQYVEFTTEAGLPPWRIAKVFHITQSDEAAPIRFSGVDLETRLGGTLEDASSAPRSMIDGPFASAPTDVGLRLVGSHHAATSVNHRVFAGMSVPPGGGARRAISPVASVDVAQLRRMAQKRRNMRALVERDNGSAARIAQVNDLIQGLSPNAAVELLFQLAMDYRDAGDVALAAEMMERLSSDFPAHPLNDVALKWLLQYYASGEMGRRTARLEAAHVQQATHFEDSRGALSAANSRHDRADMRVDPLVRAVAIGRRIEQTRPFLFADPSVRLPLAVAHASLGYANDAERVWLSLRHRQNDAFWEIAQTEDWLTERGAAPPPKPILNCRRATPPPRLDGVLNEPFWRETKETRLTSGRNSAFTPGAQSKEASSAFRLAYDDRFLYVGVVCEKTAEATYETDAEPRTRDADMSRRDHVTLHFDIDRDYTTYWSLSIDHRGWTHDGCWGDDKWNPRWFVAASSDAVTWTIEAAIPLDELTSSPINADSAWAMGASRNSPRERTRTWPGTPDADLRPEHFGVLMFGD